MAIRIKVQKDYYETEVSIELPADVSQVDELLRATRTSGKMIVLYNDGTIQAINVDQHSKIPESKTVQIKEILGLADKKV